MAWNTRRDALFPSFVAPMSLRQIADALERLEELTSNETTCRYVESLRLAIERTDLLGRDRAAKKA